MKKHKLRIREFQLEKEVKSPILKTGFNPLLRKMQKQNVENVRVKRKNVKILKTTPTAIYKNRMNFQRAKRVPFLFESFQDGIGPRKVNQVKKKRELLLTRSIHSEDTIRSEMNCRQKGKQLEASASVLNLDFSMGPGKFPAHNTRSPSWIVKCLSRHKKSPPSIQIHNFFLNSIHIPHHSIKSLFSSRARNYIPTSTFHNSATRNSHELSKNIFTRTINIPTSKLFMMESNQFQLNFFGRQII